MASAPLEPLQALHAAMNLQQNSKEQADILTQLREFLETHPNPIPILVSTFLGTVVNAADSLFKKWVIDLLHFGICRSTLSLDQRTQMASQSLDTLAYLLDDPIPNTVKVVIQTFTGAYPLLFRHFCNNRTNPAAWHTLSQCKSRILEYVWASTAGVGVKLSAMKFLQRVILVQTRGISDPRLQKQNDPNLSMCPADHPFISIQRLEPEGQALLKKIIELLYTSRNVDLLTALVNSWPNLIKLRPTMIQVILPALHHWTPTALTGLSALSIKSVEKSIRILLTHLSRTPAFQQYVPQIGEILSIQGIRMDKAAQEEKKRRAAAAENRKRPPPPSATMDQPSDAKRPKLEPDVQAPHQQPQQAQQIATSAYLSAFDFTTLPAALITDLIVANIESFTEAALVNLVNAYRQSRGLGQGSTPMPVAAPLVAPAAPSIATPVPVGPTLTPAPTSTSVPLPSHPIPTGPKAERERERERDREKGRDKSPTPTPVTPPIVKDEPVDPLQMDIDQDELEYEPEKLNEELLGGAAPVEDAAAAEIDVLSNGFKMIDFKLPPPKELSEAERIPLIDASIMRITTGGEEMRVNDVTVLEGSQASNQLASDMWMLLLVRMITRLTEPPTEEFPTDGGDGQLTPVHDFIARQDNLRQVLCDYIMQDFPMRIRLATTWMNEEWYNDWVRSKNATSNWRPNYDTWLNQIVAGYQVQLDGKDRTFSRFLLDLPRVPSDVLDLLRELCVDSHSPDRMQVGFTTLRGLVIQRPSLRSEALKILLELTTHPEKKTRGAAINTVKLWVPNVQPMGLMIRDFALDMLRKLQVVHRPTEKAASTGLEMETGAQKPGVDHEMQDAESEGEVVEPIHGANGTAVSDSADMVVLTSKGLATASEREEGMEEGQLPVEELAYSPYVPDRVELPVKKSQVLQYVELLFALSVKVPSFLDEIFIAYGQMDVTVQQAIQDLITALIRSLGSSHGKLLTLMRTCPPGSESLALRVLQIFTENGRPSGQLVALVKALINERDLDAHFLVPIIAEMDKPDILRHLPRIVALLNGTQENKDVVRSVFNAIVAAPPQTFGSVTSNQPRVQQSEELTPTELMVLLHNSEKEIGLKAAIEAIGICFSMTDVFRSEVLAAVMQQIVDELTLPTLFMRTVIQAVTTYKTLAGYVSTTLLSRLITKKIWSNPALWEGFIRCAKVIAPASFGALLQLPKDQLRELLDKQPGLKAGLRTFVIKKAPSKARGPGFTEIFGEAPNEDENGPNSTGQTETTVAASA